jgi:hypothetical protein
MRVTTWSFAESDPGDVEVFSEKGEPFRIARSASVAMLTAEGFFGVKYDASEVSREGHYSHVSYLRSREVLRPVVVQRILSAWMREYFHGFIESAEKQIPDRQWKGILQRLARIVWNDRLRWDGALLASVRDINGEAFRLGISQGFGETDFPGFQGKLTLCVPSDNTVARTYAFASVMLCQSVLGALTARRLCCFVSAANFLAYSKALFRYVDLWQATGNVPKVKVSDLHEEEQIAIRAEDRLRLRRRDQRGPQTSISP